MERPAHHSRVLVWDLPTRVFHWCLLISFSAAWLTAENDRFLYHHVFAGYSFFGLLIFRLLWGMIGTYYARFRSFSYDWPSVTAYLKGLITGQASRHLGHNPAGSWAIFAMLAMGLLISITGLLVLGGEEGHGPLKSIVSFEVGNVSKELHESLASLMLLVVALHLIGVIVESFIHKENLIWAMLSGNKPAGLANISVRTYPLIAVLMLALLSGAALVYFYGYITQTEEQPFLAFKHDSLPTNTTWSSECGDCHLAFHPTLLPARSWRRILDEQTDHFGDDLFLETEVLEEIRDFLIQNAAESGLTEAGHKINASVPKNTTPIRISETVYWKKKHEDIAERYWQSKKVGSKANCNACHLDASEGWFEDSNMKLPKL